MSQYIKEMKLDDIFDISFKMIGKTFTRNIVIIAIMFLLPLLLVFGGMFTALSTLSNMVVEWQEYTPGFSEIVTFIMLPLLLIIAGGFIAFITNMWGMLALYIVTGKEMEGERVSWGEALSLAGKRLLSGIGFNLLMGLVIMLLVMVPYIVVIVAAIADSIGAVIVGVLLFFVAIVLTIYISIRWTFGMNAIALEQCSAIKAFSRSAVLVQNKWWRVFAILFLLGMITTFVASLIASPAIFLVFIGPYIELISHSINDTQIEPVVLLELIKNIAVGYLLMFVVAVTVTYLIQPVYTTVLYYDCRARNGEFQPEDPEQPVVSDDSMQLGESSQNLSV